jgi:hypothetical protein
MLENIAKGDHRYYYLSELIRLDTAEELTAR